MSETPRNCGACRFYDESFEECRRRAPISLPTMFYALCLALCRRDEEAEELVGELAGQAGWARVRADDWCGEYRSRGKAP